MISELNPTEIVKHLKVTQECSRCKKTVCKAHKIVTVPINYSISDLSKQAAVLLSKAICKQHPAAHLVASYSFYHEEKLTLNNSNN
jgi:hypothetical protein